MKYQYWQRPALRTHTAARCIPGTHLLGSGHRVRLPPSPHSPPSLPCQFSAPPWRSICSLHAISTPSPTRFNAQCRSPWYSTKSRPHALAIYVVYIYSILLLGSICIPCRAQTSGYARTHGKATKPKPHNMLRTHARAASHLPLPQLASRRS